jgi:hypothetical protein
VARLANISGKEAARAFEKAGWRAIDQHRLSLAAP